MDSYLVYKLIGAGIQLVKIGLAKLAVYDMVAVDINGTPAQNKCGRTTHLKM